MHRVSRFARALALATLVAGPAAADEIGGTGFDVPQAAAAEEWLWGVEGLVRTPVDLSVDFGVSFRNYEVDGRNIYDDRAESAGVVTRTGTLEFEPESIEGGFRIAGGLGYWSCCVLIEPAMAFRANRPFGNERTDDTPTVINPNGSQPLFAELEIKEGWELVFGPQMTWMIPDDTPFVGRHLGGLPLVFFPVIGVSHIDWDVEGVFDPPDPEVYSGDFEDDALTVGFDLDIPLPGSRRDFTHALTFGFRWVEGNDDHDLGPFDLQGGPSGGVIPPGTGGCGVGSVGSNDEGCVNFDGLEGWRIGLYYRVTWNDFEGFFKRNIFGPVR